SIRLNKLVQLASAGRGWQREVRSAKARLRRRSVRDSARVAQNRGEPIILDPWIPSILAPGGAPISSRLAGLTRSWCVTKTTSCVCASRGLVVPYGNPALSGLPTYRAILSARCGDSSTSTDIGGQLL